MNENRKVFVARLAPHVGDEELQEFFERNWGPVRNAHVARSKDTGQSLNYGFVEFEDEDSAIDAKREGSGMNLSGREIEVKPVRVKPEREPRYLDKYAGVRR